MHHSTGFEPKNFELFDFPRPFVSLVGAGPGCGDLITLRGQRMLAIADVVLYDALVHPSLLAHCKKDAVLIHVGKRKGVHAKNQKEILALIHDYYKDDAVIVRLKGGDPMIFGRGGEEATYLSRHGMNFDIVPGVSSLVGVPAAVGISLTHRDVSRQVTALTGNFGNKGELSDNPWDIHIPDSETLVFFMATTTLPQLRQRLLAHKKLPEDTPCALISSGTMANEQYVASTLGRVLTDAKASGVMPPALFIVGDVVSKKVMPTPRPLKGKRVVLFRDIESGSLWRKSLELLGCDVVHLPLVSYDMKPFSTPSWQLFSQSKALFFSSRQGVKAFFKGLMSQNDSVDTRQLAGYLIAALGESTCDELRLFGINPDFLATTPSLEPALAEFDTFLSTLNHANTPIDVFFPCSSLTQLPNQQATYRSMTVHPMPFYTPNYQSSTISYKSHEDDVVLLASPSQANAVFNDPNIQIGPDPLLVAIGPTTEGYLKNLSMKNKILVCNKPSIQGVVDVLQGI